MRNQYLKLFTVIGVLAIAISAALTPRSYPIASFMVGIGRFSDFYDNFKYAKLFPGNGSYCVAPWHLLFNQWAASRTLLDILFLLQFFAIPVLGAKIFSLQKETKGENSVWMYGLIFSYPALFGAWRGNIEVVGAYLITIAAYTAAIAPTKSPANYSIFASALLKPNLAFFSVIYIYKLKRNYIYAGVTSAFIAIALAAAFGDLEQLLKASTTCYQNYFNEYVVGHGGLLFNNSLFGLFKALSLIFQFEESTVSLIHTYGRYCTVLLLAAAAISLLRKYPIENKILIITSAYVLFNPVSADYRLSILILPTILLYNKKEKLSSLIILMAILIPKHFIWFQPDEIGTNLTLNTILNPILLLIVLANAIIHEPKRS